MATAIASSRARGLKIVADPIRGRDYRKYHGLLGYHAQPVGGAGLATGMTIQTNQDA